jgi:hypothetical protein
MVSAAVILRAVVQRRNARACCRVGGPVVIQRSTWAWVIEVKSICCWSIQVRNWIAERILLRSWVAELMV